MAGDYTSALTPLTDITECCICLKTFNDPKMLPCIHTFCLQCLQGLVDESNKKPGDEVQCPVCRKEFIIPNDGVQGMQTNFFIVGMIEVKTDLNAPKRAVLCDRCKANSENHAVKIPEATNRCLVCQENLCESCSKLHKTFKMMKNHEIVKIGNDVGKEEEEVVKISSTTNCNTHCGKVLDYYCAECQKVVCVSCFVESHRTHDCKDVNTVEQEFRQAIKSSAHVISILAGELLAKKKKSQRKENFLKKVGEREKEILRRSEELKEMIDIQTIFLLSSLEEIKNRHLKELQTEDYELDWRLTVLESFSRYGDELRRKGSASDICRSKEEILRRADELEEDHETYIMRPKVSSDVIFQETDLYSILESRNIIGSLKEHDERLEDFAVMIGRAAGNVYSYKINLHRQCEIDSIIENVPSTVKSCPAASVYNNTMFITGIGETINEIWKYNFVSGWKKCGSLVQGRECHCAEFVGETLYICGGSKGDIVTDSIEAYNAFTEDSTMVGQLIFGSQRAACVAYKGSIYVFGGFDKNWQPLDCVQVFSPVEGTCTLLSTPLPRPCAGLRAVLWDICAMLQTHDTCFVYDFEGKTWQEGKQFKTDAYPYLFGLVLSNERVFIVDGSPLKPDGRFVSPRETKADVKYIRAASVLSKEASKWKEYGQLPKLLSVIATAKLSSAKIINRD